MLVLLRHYIFDAAAFSGGDVYFDHLDGIAELPLDQPLQDGLAIGLGWVHFVPGQAQRWPTIAATRRRCQWRVPRAA